MIKLFFHKASIVLIAVLVLFSTFSFSVEKHFCGKTLVDVSVFTSAKKCGMDSPKTASNTVKAKKSCCKDVVELISGQDDLESKNLEKLTFNQQQFLTTFVLSYSKFLEVLPKKTLPFLDYEAPPLITDIALLDDVFLI